MENVGKCQAWWQGEPELAKNLALLFFVFYFFLVVISVKVLVATLRRCVYAAWVEDNCSSWTTEGTGDRMRD